MRGLFGGASNNNHGVSYGHFLIEKETVSLWWLLLDLVLKPVEALMKSLVVLSLTGTSCGPGILGLRLLSLSIVNFVGKHSCFGASGRGLMETRFSLTGATVLNQSVSIGLFTLCRGTMLL